MKKLSIIIVTYNSERDIFDCVRSVEQNLDLPKEEVQLIVVDNCSRSAESMFVGLRQIWGDDISCIRNDRNGGYGQGNNLGLKESIAPVALIMNPDVRLVCPIFAHAVNRFNDSPSLGILGMSQYYPSGRKSRNSLGVTWLVNGYLRTVLQVVANRYGWYLPRYMYAQGSCFFVRRDMFEAVGMFDDTNFMYGEEEDLHYRMIKRYGTESQAFDSSLKYIHLSEGRISTFEYEKRLIDANVSLYSKKGVDTRLILKHFRQNAVMQLWYRRILSSQRNYVHVLKQIIDYIDSQLQ